MKQFVITLFIILSSSVTCQAQKYLDHIQQKAPGLGTVTVHQSKAIDELVNGKATAPQDNKTTTKTTPQDNKTVEPQHKSEVQHKTTETQHKTTETQHKTTETQHNNATAKSDSNKQENETPVVDMRKKVMRKSYKVPGYRVQAYAGGNSRNDRMKAEQTGNALKMSFPDQPVYVHFYSPRWICRMGNFRNLNEAQKMLAKVKAMGYKQACLVKGQISVQY